MASFCARYFVCFCGNQYDACSGFRETEASKNVTCYFGVESDDEMFQNPFYQGDSGVLGSIL